MKTSIRHFLYVFSGNSCDSSPPVATHSFRLCGCIVAVGFAAFSSKTYSNYAATQQKLLRTAAGGEESERR